MTSTDRNDTDVWEDTQLAAYLRGAFLDALRKETTAAYFCCANDGGYADYTSASDAYTYVRPRFIILKSKS